jgi:ankyrin repeat protein
MSPEEIKQAEKLRQDAAAGNAEAVLSALASGAPVDSRGEFGDTALNLAADRGHEGVVAILLGAGAGIENLGGADKTPMMNAAFAGHIGIVRMLLAKGARVTDDLLSSLSVKVSILEENAEDGMVRPEAASAWRNFLNAMIAEREKQDGTP